MASPWKLLARLISPGREQKRENGSDQKVTPDPLAIAGPTETPAEKSLISAVRPASEGLPRHGHSPAISTEFVVSKEVGIGIGMNETEEAISRRSHDQVDGQDAKIVEAADPPPFGELGTDIVAGHDATKLVRTLEVAPRKKASAAIANAAPAIHTADQMSLDEDIRVLRGQLARKLRLQNAQLRTMLERFER
ncbi:hypothetical protein B5K10_33190 [Rhizobium leguminosarum bv. trifolii]|uniref:Uncharacterized protein n=3 Tax=Rhizobium TaxID=379 RepID=A0A246DKM2_9HYPH|nr:MULTISPECIES: hypothetical protein [Rhizobium]KPH04673.1 hypothetical protein AOG23_32030 [Rhizobium acidisoli]OWO89476.1 hypothetical protein B5E41_30470 [Rhizobium esperanzae]QAS81223.1 hypothetical protein CO657_25345 [Rhizobium acidisoli]RFB81636.1 hypothetical protein B5K10_33190 [Rhizobium leguminosarum bv. trifolii]RFB83365.1 hypothetical protein B5K11_34870 [Rhizobium leguminosarum bv. trifolii]